MIICLVVGLLHARFGSEGEPWGGGVFWGAAGGWSTPSCRSSSVRAREGNGDGRARTRCTLHAASCTLHKRSPLIRGPLLPISVDR